MNFRIPNIPTVTKYLLIINFIVYVFTHWISNGQLGDVLALRYFQSPEFAPWQIVTSMFTHAGGWHILVNMFILFQFGSALERVWGPERFLKLYFIAGLGAVLLHQGVQYFEIQRLLTKLPDGALDLISRRGDTIHYPLGPDSEVYLKLAKNYFSQTVGASGAIFGLLVAFGMLFPNMVLYIYGVLPLKAKAFIPIIIVVELLLGVGNFEWDNIAHFAHLGGALIGFILVKIWQKDRTVFY